MYKALRIYLHFCWIVITLYIFSREKGLKFSTMFKNNYHCYVKISINWKEINVFVVVIFISIYHIFFFKYWDYQTQIYIFSIFSQYRRLYQSRYRMIYRLYQMNSRPLLELQRLCTSPIHRTLCGVWTHPLIYITY